MLARSVFFSETSKGDKPRVSCVKNAIASVRAPQAIICELEVSRGLVASAKRPACLDPLNPSPAQTLRNVASVRRAKSCPSEGREREKRLRPICELKGPCARTRQPANHWEATVTSIKQVCDRSSDDRRPGTCCALLEVSALSCVLTRDPLHLRRSGTQSRQRHSELVLEE